MWNRKANEWHNMFTSAIYFWKCIVSSTCTCLLFLHSCMIWAYLTRPAHAVCGASNRFEVPQNTCDTCVTVRWIVDLKCKFFLHWEILVSNKKKIAAEKSSVAHVEAAWTIRNSLASQSHAAIWCHCCSRRPLGPQIRLLGPVQVPGPCLSCPT